MNRQRKVVITTTYNEMGIIIDTKAEELDLSAQPETHDKRTESHACDLIDRQAAIDAVECIVDHYSITPYQTMRAAIDHAKRIISGLPSAQPIATDCISRRAAIDAMADTIWHYPNECYRNLNSYEFAKALAELGLRSVPSAQPEQQEIIRCKECKHWEYDVIFADGWCRGKQQGNPEWFCADAERKEGADG